MKVPPGPAHWSRRSARRTLVAPFSCRCLDGALPAYVAAFAAATGAQRVKLAVGGSGLVVTGLAPDFLDGFMAVTGIGRFLRGHRVPVRLLTQQLGERC